MKISKLRFKNLNSLKGEFLIDFSLPPLVDAGLFAVTGSTGAGKSTIFDALCLGLYGETPRLRKRRSGGEGIFEIVSRHTAEAMAEVEFMVDGARYRSAWEAHRARGSVEGQFQAPKMYLLALEGSGATENDGQAGTLLEEKLSEVPSRVAELTGLDFERFTRSVLLAQGAFAAFLQAEPAQRADLLEKMTGSAIYSEVSRLSFERAKEEQRRFDELHERKGALQILDDQELSVLEAANSRAESLFSDLQKKRDTLIAAIEKARRFRQSEELLTRHKQELNRLDQERPLIADLRMTLSAHDRALPVQPLLSSWEDKSRELKGLEERLSGRRAALSELQRREVETIQVEAEAAARLKDAEQAKSSALENSAEAERIDSELAYKRSSLKELQSEVARDQDSREALEAEVSQANEARALLEQGRLSDSTLLASEASARLEQKAELVRHYFSILEASRRAVQPLQERAAELSRAIGSDTSSLTVDWEELRQLERQLHGWDDLARHASRLESLRAGLQDRDASLRGLRSELDELNASLEEERTRLTEAEEAERRDAALALRAGLKRGVACPVCGSTEHPKRGEQELFADVPVGALPTDELRGRIREKELHQAELNERLKGLTALQSDEEAEIRKIEDILAESDFTAPAHEKLRQNLGELQTRWDEAERLKPLRREYEECRRELLQQTDEIERAAVALGELLQDTGISPDSEHASSRSEELITRYREARDQEQRRKERERDLDREDTIRREKRAELEERLTRNLERSEQLEAEISKGEEALSALTGGVPFQDFLVARKRAMEEALKAHREVREVLSSIREDLAGERSAIDATLSMTDDARARLEELREDLDRKIEAAGFDGISALSAAFHDDAEELRLKLRDFEEREAELKRRVEELSRELEEAPEELREVETLEARLTALIEEYNSALARRQELSSQLRNEQNRRLEAEALQRQIEAQRKELALWLRLKELIGSATGDSFRRFAQGLTLEYLIRLANRHLMRFSGRYMLRREEGSELRMEIVDTWQADAVRPVGTLSGGETFLVSLALALGLSELAGRKTRIDSLFLDEGFGSLDGETLETVIAALESLQSGGKLIGIISHVEALKERIPVQIRVQRHGTGYSRLAIVP